MMLSVPANEQAVLGTVLWVSLVSVAPRQHWLSLAIALAWEIKQESALLHQGF